MADSNVSVQPDSDDRYPTPDMLPRAVLVRNLSPLVTSATLMDFFSFNGDIESHRLLPIPSSSPARQQAVIVFADAGARENALDVDGSNIVELPAAVTTVPEAFDFDKPVAQTHAEAPLAFLGSGLAAFNDLFAGVGSAVSNEVSKASRALDSAANSAANSAVVKSARDGVALASQRTKNFAEDIDSKWRVRQNVINVAEASKNHATAVASAVATQTSSLASTVDTTLHISENTEKLAVKARSNATVNSGLRAFSGGFQSLLAQTGLQQQQQQPPTSNNTHNDNDSNPADSSAPNNNPPKDAAAVPTAAAPSQEPQ